MELEEDKRIKAQCKEMEDAYNLEIKTKEVKRKKELERKETILKDFEDAYLVRNEQSKKKGEEEQEKKEKPRKQNEKESNLLFKGETGELMSIKDIMNSKYMSIKAHLIRLKVYD